MPRSGFSRRPLVDQFRHAFDMRDAAALRRLGARGEEIRRIVNEPMFAFGSPALLVASNHDNVDVVDALLDLGADPNGRSDWWAGPFHSSRASRCTVARRWAGVVTDP